MWGESLFNLELVKFINQELNSSEHLFVLFGVSELNEFEQYQNIDYETDEGLQTLYKYSSLGENIILHSLSYSAWEILCMKKYVSKKITWCVWGHDLYRCYSPIIFSEHICLRYYQILKQFLRPMHKRMMNIVWTMADEKIKNFKSIVLGFKGDQDRVIKRFGSEIKIFYTAYTSGYYSADIASIPKSSEKKSELNILIGHSSFPFLQHKKYLDRLQKYKDENIKIILPLSYGNLNYGNEIEAYAKNIFGNKLLIIRNTMDWINYTSLISHIDIGIFDYEHQSALGNVTLLLYFGGKVYLSPTGILSKGYGEEGINTYDCNEIGTVSFDTFRKHIFSPEKGKKYASNLLDKQSLIEKWSCIFDYNK